MACTNTIVGLRKSSLTVLASNGLRVTGTGVIVNHKANRVSKVYQDKILFASTFNETLDETIREELLKELEKSGGNLRKAVHRLSNRLSSLPLMSGQHGEVVIGSREMLISFDVNGNLLEPDEGFLAAGSAALIATGAAKALLTFSDLGVEQIARQALLLTASICHCSNDQIFHEWL